MPRKAKKGSPRYYFHQGTEDAIIRHNKETRPHMRERIYNEHIRTPFEKLAENIIHTFKFYYTDVEQIEDLKHEIVSVLLEEKISKFDPTNGAKAYSYFGTIVKRWCILYNDKNYKKKVNKAPVDELMKDDKYTYSIESDSPQDKLSYFIDEYVDYVTENLNDFFPKSNDAQIADAILELFRKREGIEIFNKKALYIYIHEIIPEVPTPKITKIANSLRDIFQKHYIFYLENGYINF